MTVPPSMTGAMASMTGVPSEVVLVRMAADNKLPLVRPTPRLHSFTSLFLHPTSTYPITLLWPLAFGLWPLQDDPARRNYSNVISAIGRIAKEEGVTALHRCCALPCQTVCPLPLWSAGGALVVLVHCRC